MKYKQIGQAMVEYIIVTSAIVTTMFLGANAECPGFDNCISKVLTVMHDNYEGYSSAMSSVQKYGEYEASDSSDDDSGGGSGGGSGGSGGTGETGLNPDGIAEVTLVTSTDGVSTYGFLRPDGTVVDADGNIVGFYSEADGTLTGVDGSVINVDLQKVVVDEVGNILHLRAITGCTGSPRPVYSWGYQSKVSGRVFNSVNQNELQIGNLCTAASFKVVDGEGDPQAGRIIDGEYYAAIFAIGVSDAPLEPTGEVIYWEDFGICSVMAKDWDEDVNGGGVFAYIQRLALFGDDDANIGRMDQIDYVEQTAIFEVATEPNDCPSNRTISQP